MDIFFNLYISQRPIRRCTEYGRQLRCCCYLKRMVQKPTFFRKVVLFVSTNYRNCTFSIFLETKIIKFFLATKGAVCTGPKLCLWAYSKPGVVNVTMPGMPLHCLSWNVRHVFFLNRAWITPFVLAVFSSKWINTNSLKLLN